MPLSDITASVLNHSSKTHARPSGTERLDALLHQAAKNVRSWSTRRRKGSSASAFSSEPASAKHSSSNAPADITNPSQGPCPSPHPASRRSAEPPAQFQESSRSPHPSGAADPTIVSPDSSAEQSQKGALSDGARRACPPAGSWFSRTVSSGPLERMVQPVYRTAETGTPVAVVISKRSRDFSAIKSLVGQHELENGASNNAILPVLQWRDLDDGTTELWATPEVCVDKVDFYVGAGRSRIPEEYTPYFARMFEAAKYSVRLTEKLTIAAYRKKMESMKYQMERAHFH